MLLRVKEETPAELAGFVVAVRSFHNYSSAQIPGIAVDIDWSSYAGKKRHLPWFLISALTLVGQGIKVFMYGLRATPKGAYTAKAYYNNSIFLQPTIGIKLKASYLKLILAL